MSPLSSVCPSPEACAGRGLRDQTLCEDEDSDVFITRTQVLGADEAQRLADEEQCPIGKSAWNKGGTWEEKDHSK